jgi:hypothetical protein
VRLKTKGAGAGRRRSSSQPWRSGSRPPPPPSIRLRLRRRPSLSVLRDNKSMQLPFHPLPLGLPSPLPLRGIVAPHPNSCWGWHVRWRYSGSLAPSLAPYGGLGQLGQRGSGGAPPSPPPWSPSPRGLPSSPLRRLRMARGYAGPACTVTAVLCWKWRSTGEMPGSSIVCCPSSWGGKREIRTPSSRSVQMAYASADSLITEKLGHILCGNAEIMEPCLYRSWFLITSSACKSAPFS